MQLIFTISPPTTGDRPQDFTPTDIAHLSQSVAAFVLMTYDFSDPSRPGPNAPLPWLQASLKFMLPSVGPTYKSHHWGPHAADTYGGHGRELKSVGGVAGEGEGGGGGGGGGRASELWLGVQFFGNDFVLPQG